MKLAELNDDERLALIGLLKLVVRADSELSAGEASTLRAVADKIGQQHFSVIAQEAQRRFVSTADIKKYATEKVKRPEARALIYTFCHAAAVPRRPLGGGAKRDRLAGPSVEAIARPKDAPLSNRSAQVGALTPTRWWPAASTRYRRPRG